MTEQHRQVSYTPRCFLRFFGPLRSGAWRSGEGTSARVLAREAEWIVPASPPSKVLSWRLVEGIDATKSLSLTH